MPARKRLAFKNDDEACEFAREKFRQARAKRDDARVFVANSAPKNALEALAEADALASECGDALDTTTTGNVLAKSIRESLDTLRADIDVLIEQASKQQR